MSDYIQKGSPQYMQTISPLFLASVAAFGAEYCVQPIIPLLSSDFGITPSTASMAMSCGTGGMALAMIVIAGLAERLDRKKTISAALLGSAILALAIAVSTNFGFILLLRLLQGILLAAVPALIIAYINEEFHPDIIGLVVGIYVSGTSIGGLLGRVVLSTLTDIFTWRTALASVSVIYFLIGIWFSHTLAKSKHHRQKTSLPANFFQGIRATLLNKQLVTIYCIAFAVSGSFVAMYNYLPFPLMSPPYNLTQTSIGALFAVYLVGTFSSTFMGGMSDNYGSGRVLGLSVLIMLFGALITLAPALVVKIVGLAVFTFGFFAAHATASSWASKTCVTDKAQGSALYMLFFYTGSSVIGTLGGVFLLNYNWPGLVLMICTLLGGALLLSAKLVHLSSPCQNHAN